MVALLKVADVADRLDVSPKTVYRLLAAGELKRIKVRSSTRIDERDVEAYVAAQNGKDKSAAPIPLTDGQLRALHAKAGELDRRLGYPRGRSKASALAHVAEWSKRTVESANDLTSIEASIALDWLESELSDEERWRE
ncbi:MAG: helix-turn-helix domain-containing protein [Actinomycetota bacterium]|nr:helix-turn-helix domain-containing protein [Actinomycetota bacterium]